MENEELREEVKQIRERLSQINKRKEAAFARKKELSESIKGLIAKAVATRKERDSLTAQAKEAKKERNALHDQLKVKIQNVTGVKPQAKRDGPNPGFLKKKLAQLERSMEIEVMSFKREKDLMKQIKDIKKELTSLASKDKDTEKFYAENKELRKLKKDSQDKHKTVQENAVKSQELHEDMVKVSKEIDTLREDEKKADEEFRQIKQEYAELNNTLKKKLGELGEEVKEHRAVRDHERAEQAKKDKKTMSEKVAEVNDKIARGEKLTTEDLLILQQSS